MNRAAKIASIFLMCVLLLSSSLALFPALFPSNRASATSASTTLTLGYVGGPICTFVYNPTCGGGPGGPDADIPYETMMRELVNGSIIPNIVQIPVPVPGTNYTQWIYNLAHPNEKWSDGYPINSTDLAYSIGLFMKTGPYANISEVDYNGMFRNYGSSVQIINSTAVKLTMSRPYSPLVFPILTWIYEVYPYHYLIHHLNSTSAFQKTPMLSGPGDSPYIISSYSPGSYTYTLQANPNAWEWNGNTPSIQTIQVSVFTTDSALLSALAAGQIDAAPIAESDLAAVSSISSLSVATIPGSVNAMYFWTSTVGYPFNNTYFRQALLYLIDAKTINSELYNNTGVEGNTGIVVPGLVSERWPADGPTYNFSTTTAVQLLKQAGLSQNSKGNWVMPNGTVLNLNMITDSSDPNYVRGAQIIQADMLSVGLQVSFTAYQKAQENAIYHPNPPPNEPFEIMLQPNYNAPDPFKTFQNPYDFPTWGYSNATFQSTVEAAVSSLNVTQQAELIKEAVFQMAYSATSDAILFLPAYVAYNHVDFTGWTPALYNVFTQSCAVHSVTVVLDPLVLTAVTPTSTISSTTSLSSTASSGPTASTTSQSSSTTSSSSSAIALTSLAGIVAVTLVVVVAGAAVIFIKRRPTPS